MERPDVSMAVGKKLHTTNYCKFSAAQVQQLIRSYQSNDEESSSEKLRPTSHTFESVVLFVDISGFTRLCHRLRPEATKWHINTYFTMMIDIIFSFGGDVHKFIGDAIICVWPLPVGASREETVTKGLTAVRCALSLMESECSRYDQVESGVQVSLRLHAGITHGFLHAYHVGSSRDECWEYLIAGKPLSEMSSALDNASHGEVCVSSSFWHDVVKQYCEGSLHSSGNYLVYKLASCPDFLMPAPSFSIADVRGSQSKSITESLSDVDNIIPYLSYQKRGTSHALLDMKQSVVVEALAGLVPGVARHHAVNDSLDYLSELRTVTVMFINVDSLIPYLDGGDLAKVQECMDVTSRCVHDKQGTFVQFVYDDKGVVIIAAFGLPGRSHENDIRRGLLCAVKVQEELAKIHLTTDIGITTGKVYCGLVGSSYRCAFGVMGASMNLAARLMGACMKKSFSLSTEESKFGIRKDDVHIICNDILQAGAMQDPKCFFKFIELPVIKAKGYDEPVKIFIPVKSSREYENMVMNNNTFKSISSNEGLNEQFSGIRELGIIGRHDEEKRIRKHIPYIEEDVPEFVSADKTCKMLFLVGEAGLGKSHLLQHVAWRSMKDNYHKVVSVHGDSENMGAPLLLWMPLVQNAVKIIAESLRRKNRLYSGDDATSLNMHTILRLLEKSVGVKRKRYCMLLAPFFPTLKSVPLSGQLKSIAGTKLGTTHQIDMIVDILSKAAGSLIDSYDSQNFDDPSMRKMVILIEDAHFLDPTSWKLLCTIAERQPENVVIVSAMRPLHKYVRQNAILEIYDDIIVNHGNISEEVPIHPLTKYSCGHLLAHLLKTERNIIENDGIESFMEYRDEKIINHGHKLPDQFVDLIFERCNGNPLFLLGLVEVIQSEFGVCESKSDTDADGDYVLANMDKDRLSKLQKTLPANIQAVVTARFDKLSTQAQLVLKTASVLGHTFSFMVLEKCYHHSDSMTNKEKKLLIDTAMIELVQANFILMKKKWNTQIVGESVKQAVENKQIDEFCSKLQDAEFSFDSRVLYEIVYELMLKEQRAAIHMRVGRYYEACHQLQMLCEEMNSDSLSTATDLRKRSKSEKMLEPLKPESEKVHVSLSDLGDITTYELNMRLAYHWSRTDKPDKGVKYLKKAGKHAASIGAYEEAEELFYRAWKANELRLLRIGIDIDSEVFNADTDPYGFSLDSLYISGNVSLPPDEVKRPPPPPPILPITPPPPPPPPSLCIQTRSIETASIPSSSPVPGTLSILIPGDSISVHVNTISEPEKEPRCLAVEKYTLNDESDDDEMNLRLRRKKRDSIVTDSKWNHIEKNLRRASSTGTIEFSTSDMLLEETTAQKSELSRSMTMQIPPGKRPSYHKHLRKHSLSTPPSSAGIVSRNSPPSPRRSSYVAKFSQRRESDMISINQLSQADELMSAGGRDIQLDENIPSLLIQLTEDLCDLVVMYDRYRVPKRVSKEESPRKLLVRAKVLQHHLARNFTGKVDARSIATVLHTLAFHLMFNPEEFEKEHIQYLVCEYFISAIEFRKQVKDWPSVAESLNGLGTCYQKLASAQFRGLVQETIIPRNDNVSTSMKRGVYSPILQQEKGNGKDLLKRRTQVKVLLNLAEETFLECLSIRKKYAKAEMGQVETSLGNFYLRFRNDLKSAERYFQDAIKSYSMFQGERNPRSAYALDGLARTYLCKANTFKDKLEELDRLEMASGDEAIGLVTLGALDEELSTPKDTRNDLIEQRQHSLYLAYSLAYISAEIRQDALSAMDPLYKTTMALLDTISEIVHWPWEDSFGGLYHLDEFDDNIKAKSIQDVENFCAQMLHNVDFSRRSLRGLKPSNTLGLLRQSSFFFPSREEQLTDSASKYWPELKYYVGWSTALGGCVVEPEESRALASMLAFHWILANKYEYFIRCQNNENPLCSDWGVTKYYTNTNSTCEESNNRLRPDQFNQLRKFVYEKVRVDNPADINMLMTLLAVTDLFKVDSFILDAVGFLFDLELEKVEAVDSSFDRSDLEGNSSDDLEHDSHMLAFDNSNDRSVLLQVITCEAARKKYLPSVERLLPTQREMILRGLGTGFILGQFVQLESVPASLKCLRKLAMEDPRCCDLYLLHMLLDIAGARGEVSLRGSLTLDKETCERLVQAIYTLDLFKQGFSEIEVYDRYVRERGESLTCKCTDPRNSPSGKIQRAQIRLCGMLRIESFEGAQHVVEAWKLLSESEQVVLSEELNRTGIADGWAMVPYHAPRLLKMFYIEACEGKNVVGRYELDEDDNSEASVDDFSANALAMGFRLLIRVLKKARAVVNTSTLPEQSANGFYVVKMTNLTKKHVIDSVLQDRKFINFTIHHKDKLGEIVLGHT